MTNPSPDLIRQAEAESVANDPKFKALMVKAFSSSGSYAPAVYADTARYVDSIITARVAADRATIRDLDSIGMKFAAQLVQMYSNTIKGRDFLPRESVMTAVMDWRMAWDKNSAARKPLAASQAAPAKAEGIPDVLFDGHAVYQEVCRERGKRNFYVSTNAVSDTLDAVVRLMRRAAPSTPSGDQK